MNVRKEDNLEDLNAQLLKKLRKFNNGMDALNKRRKHKKKDLHKITKLERKILAILEGKLEGTNNRALTGKLFIEKLI